MSNDRDSKHDTVIRDAVDSVTAWREAVDGPSGDAEEAAGHAMADAIGALIDALREYDVRFVTADGVHIVDGLRVWDYDREPGTVDFAATEPERAYWDGWFRVRRDAGGHSLMNGDRLAVRDPFTGEQAPPAP